MRILCVTSNFEHPAMGGSTRYYHVIKALSKRHSITLLARARCSIPPAAREETARYTEQVLTFEPACQRTTSATASVDGLFAFSPRLQRAWRRRDAFARMRQTFERLRSENVYDLVLARGEQVLPVIGRCAGVPLVIDISDANAARLLRGLRYSGPADLPWRLLRFLQVKGRERRLAKTTAYLAFMSSRDRDAMVTGAARTKVIPNGVDLAYWARTVPSRSSNCIVFTGVMTYAPNVDGAMCLIERILPLVRRSLPDVEVVIVGRDPSAALIDAARRCRNVTVTGYVDDVRPYLERASVLAAPLRFASGIQNKVLEALAMQVPVLTTSVVAAGLHEQGRDDPPIAVADGVRPFAHRLVELMTSPTERDRLMTAGLAYVQRHFNWSHCAASIEELCLEAVATAGAREHPC